VAKKPVCEVLSHTVFSFVYNTHKFCCCRWSHLFPFDVIL